jgi:chromosomal replication initiator protein
MPSAPPQRATRNRDLKGAAEHISQQLAGRLGAHRYEMWFGSAHVCVEGNAVRIDTNSQFAADWIGANFAGELSGAVCEVLGEGAGYSLCVASPPAENGNGTASSANAAGNGLHPPAEGQERRPRRGAGPDVCRMRRLDDFVVGACNRLAYTAALGIAEARDSKVLSPLFIHGECGVGKTHLIQGVAHRFATAARGGVAVRYVTGEQFTNEYIAAVRADTIEQFRNRIRRLDLLAIDDVHFLSNKTRTQHEFQCTLDAIQHMGARIVLASDEHPRNIRRFSPGLVNRLLSGMVVQIEPPDRETRLQLIERLAASRGLCISAAAAQTIASRCAGSVRELEGAITKLTALKLLAEHHCSNGTNGQAGAAAKEIGLVLVEQLFGDAGWRPPTPVRVATIIDRVGDRLGVSRADILGGGRHRRVVLARAMVAYLAREMTTMSYPEVAEALGRRHHSTVHTAAQRLRMQIEQGKSIEFGPAQHPALICEVVDQLRHEITRATAAA